MKEILSCQIVVIHTWSFDDANERQILLISNELPSPPWNAKIVKYSTRAVPLTIVIEDYIELTSRPFGCGNGFKFAAGHLVLERRPPGPGFRISLFNSTSRRSLERNSFLKFVHGREGRRWIENEPGRYSETMVVQLDGIHCQTR